MKVQFDHVAIATRDARTQVPFIQDHLHGSKTGVHDTERFIATTWGFARGIMVEFLEPPKHDDANFVRRFLERRGESFHHLTLKVSSLDDFLHSADRDSVPLAMLDRSNPEWQEVFVLPNAGPGTLIQIVESQLETSDRTFPSECAIAAVRLKPIDFDFTLKLLTEHLKGSVVNLCSTSAEIEWQPGASLHLYHQSVSGKPGITGLDFNCTAPSPLPTGTDLPQWIKYVKVLPAE